MRRQAAAGGDGWEWRAAASEWQDGTGQVRAGQDKTGYNRAAGEWVLDAGLLVETACWVGGHQHRQRAGISVIRAGAVRDVFKGAKPLQASSVDEMSADAGLAFGRPPQDRQSQSRQRAKKQPEAAPPSVLGNRPRIRPLVALLLTWSPCPCQLQQRTLSERLPKRNSVQR